MAKWLRNVYGSLRELVIVLTQWCAKREDRPGRMTAMRTFLRLTAVLTALLAAAPPGHAQSKEALEAAARLVVKSGFAVQLQGFSQQIDADLAQNKEGMRPELRSALADAMKASFRAAALQEGIVRRLAGKMRPAEMDKVVAWLETPVGRRVTRAEERAASVSQEEMAAWAERSGRRPLTAKRIALLAELTRLTNSVDAGVAAIEAIGLGMMVGANAVPPRENQISLSELRKRFRDAMPLAATRKEVAQSAAVSNPYTYRGVSDADLAAYVAFSRTELGKRYNDATTQAFTETLAEASVAVGQLIAPSAGRKSI